MSKKKKTYLYNQVVMYGYQQLTVHGIINSLQYDIYHNI